MTFYDWLLKVANNDKQRENFREAMECVPEGKQMKIYEWLKFAYVEGYFQGSGGEVPQDDYDIEIEEQKKSGVSVTHEEVFIEDNDGSMAFMIKSKMKNNSEKLIKK